MNADLADLFQLNVIPTGRRLYAYARTQAEAEKAPGTDAVKALVAAAIIEDQKTLDLEQRWKAQRGAGKLSDKQATAFKEVQVLDIHVDRTLTAVRDGAQSLVRGALPHETELVAKVQLFLDAVFPGGVGAITSLPYAEELAAVTNIVGKLKGELAPLVAELGLTIITSRLADLVVKYDQAQKAAGGRLEFGSLKAARAAGQSRLLQVMAVIVGIFNEPGGDQAKTRAALLGPILAQDEAVRQAIRARRAVTDVDPTTGEEQAPEGDAGGSAPAGGDAKPPEAGQGG